MKLKYVKLFEEFNNSDLESKILNCNDWDDFIKILKSVYGNTIPLYHATSLENSKIIDKEGLKLVDGSNKKSFSGEPLIYFQIGESGYVASNRPVLYRYDAPIKVLEKYAYVDTDSSADTDTVIEYLTNKGYDEDEYEYKSTEIKELISACIENGFKLHGMEIYLMNVNNDEDFPIIKPTKIKN